MNINPLSINLSNIISPNSVTTFNPGGLTSEGNSDMAFSNILSDAFDVAAQADRVDKASSLELLIGQSDDMAGMLIDAQKAELSLNLALQIRNRIVDAYNEVMRMQV